MSARRVRLALVVAAVLFLLVPALSAQKSHARIVRLSYIDGQVQIDRNAGQGMEKAIQNMPIVEGTRLSVEQGGHAEVEFENDATLRLVGPAEVKFQELSLHDGKKDTLVQVQNGLAYFDLPKPKDDDFRLAFQNHSFAVKKASRFRVEVSADEQKLAVMKGEVQLLDQPKEVAVKKNETVSFQGDQAQYALAHGVDNLGADVWNQDRAQDRQLVARSEQYQATNSYYGNAYGMYDLARYGNWYYGPGYGWLWRPYFYDASYAYDPFAWDPFGNGAWSFYPGAGWTFISAYPWGWAPYRYGSWIFVPGFGWSWRPLPPSYGWQTAPVIVNPPAGYGIPRPPVKTAGATVPVTTLRPTTTIVTRPIVTAPTTGAVQNVPRPGQTVLRRDIVPTKPVVLPGALNAGRVGTTRAIGEPGTTMGRPSPTINTRPMPAQSQSAPRPQPRSVERSSPPPPPPMSMPSAPASSGSRSSGGGGAKPH